MTLVELEALLKTTGYPVSYHHFNAPPPVPFIAYIKPSEHAYGDDFTNLISSKTIRVELYTNKKDAVAEGKVDLALNFVEYYKDEVYIKEEKLYLISYDFDLINKI